MQARVVEICAAKLIASHSSKPQAADASTAQGAEESSRDLQRNKRQRTTVVSSSSSSASAGRPGVSVPLSGNARRRQKQARKQGSSAGE
jgi:hypothetical protein